MKQSKSRLVLLLAALVLIPNIALADTDWKTYPGTTCQPGNNVQVADYDAFGGICNTSTDKDLVIHCPVVRDFSKSRFPILIRHSGRSGNVDKDMRCILRNMKLDAANSGSAMGGFFAELKPIESGQSEIIRTRETDLKEVAIKSHDFGSHVLTCDLPKSNFRKDGQQITSCLYNYSIQEWDGK